MEYNTYIQKQIELESFESDIEKYRDGQKRFIYSDFVDIKKNDKYSRILDISSGDGIGFSLFRELGFVNVYGVEINERKYQRSLKYGYVTYNTDFHHLPFPDDFFDIIYSSHSLEHAIRPDIVIKEILRTSKKESLFFIVLPYPDEGDGNIEGHCGKKILGTNINDGAKTLLDNLTNFGLKYENYTMDNFRENEIWIKGRVK